MLYIVCNTINKIQPCLGNRLKYYNIVYYAYMCNIFK